MRILNASAVRESLPMATCVTLMRAAFVAEAEGRTVQPIRQAMPHPNGRGLLSMMPGVVRGPDRLGIKVVSVYPDNAASLLGSHQGMVLLFDPEDGRPLAMLDGREITGIRTAAATAAATEALAPRGPATLGVFGCGEQARAHLEALRLVLPLARVLVWGRDRAKAQAFAAQHAAGCPVEAVASPQAVAAQATVLCFTTAARDPYFEAGWLRPGQHLNAVGSSIPTTSEIDEQTVARARVFVDFGASARALAGDLRRAEAAGLIAPDRAIHSVGDVLTGRVSGRRSPEDITLFKSLGMIAQDLFAADHVLRAAEAAGAGEMVSF